MTWSPDGVTTGSAQNGLTTPTYTYSADLSPDPSARQYVVTALGGTQTGVRVHTAGDPFRMVVRKDKVYKTLPAPNPVNGAYPNVPLNKSEILITKGVKIDTAGTIRNMNVRLLIETPAGAEVNDAINIRAALSKAFGVYAEESADIGDSVVAGVW